jgi:hypothetical protein
MKVIPETQYEDKQNTKMQHRNLQNEQRGPHWKPMNAGIINQCLFEIEEQNLKHYQHIVLLFFARRNTYMYMND